MELFIQLAIIMIGKQAFNALIEMGIPYVTKKYRKFMYGSGTKTSVLEPELRLYNQWTKDFKLTPWSTMGLFYEYLEMVLQFG
jgi:hypothetical protein